MLTTNERHNIIRDNHHIGMKHTQKILWEENQEHYIEEQNKYS